MRAGSTLLQAASLVEHGVLVLAELRGAWLIDEGVCMARHHGLIAVKLIERVLECPLIWQSLDEVLANCATAGLIQLSSLFVRFSFLFGTVNDLRSALCTLPHILLHRRACLIRII